MTVAGALVEVEIRGAVALVTLNRPEALNALDRALTGELGRVAERLASEPGLKVVVTRGAGRAFCAGNDLKETATLTPREAEAFATAQGLLLDRWAALPLITLAAVGGVALGGGLVLAASHDLRMAADGARFGLPEITLGWPPAYGIHRLVRLIGEARARELARLPEGGIKATKRVLAGIVGPVRGGEPRAFAACLADDEAQTRIRSFLEQRKRR